MSETLLCPAADFVLDPHGNARAPATSDIYFSAEDGWAETRTVFLTGVGLPQRWSGRSAFTVAELGFGTGLNIVALLDLWRRHRPPSGYLHIVSVEGCPLRVDQARVALARWPALADVAAPLLAAWPPPWKGAHRRRFDALNATLTVLHEDALTALQAADFRADAWFLDGFSPARNPAMWTPEVLTEVARLSAPRATAATFTVAKAVRQGLSDVGFRVDKRDGFGRKRDRLEAVYVGPPADPDPTPFPRLPPQAGPVLIVGGGVAGASLAHALRARGRPARLIASGGLAAGASGGPMGLLTPRLEAADRPHVRATMAAFAYSRALFDGWRGFHGEGVHRCAADGAKTDRLRRIAAMLDDDFEVLKADAAASATGIPDAPPGVFMARAGRLDPGEIVRQLAGDTPIVDAHVRGVERRGDQWRLVDGHGGVIAEAPVVILAGGAAMAPIVSRFGLRIDRHAGQVSLHDPTDVPLPQRPVAWGGYLSPAGRNVLLGATHEPRPEPGDPADAEARLRAMLRSVMPAYEAALGPPVGRWASVRAASQDRLPIAGPLDRGLAILTGLGGRGFAHAPLLAEMLVGDLTGAPAAFEREALEAIHPARFEVRQRRREAALRAGSSRKPAADQD